MSVAFAFTNVPVAPMRAEPNHKAEQVNQLLFGEKVEIAETNNREWCKIKNLADGYQGWCKQAQLTLMTHKDYQKETKYLVTSNASRLELPENIMWLPIGCELPGLKNGKIAIQNIQGDFKGDKTKVKDIQINTDLLHRTALQLLYAPYQWGGRTTAGIDCSGFTQLVYKLCNIPLQRDASQQALQGEMVGFLQNSQLGDLAFFDDKDGKIIHVGLLLDHQTIIHASDTAGRVAIDRIDQGGIISLTQRRRTHQLRVVKRVFGV